MNNNQLLPFERNRYYAGKMLTSTDFQAEQLYMNNKRRFLNQVMFGPGVVCGLGITNLDDFSILVENGVALDCMGREIVVSSSVVKKLSAVEGFDQLSGDRAVLKIRYREEMIHPVYSVAGNDSGEEYEFNRIHEEYEIYLTDADRNRNQEDLKLFLREEVLLEHEDYRITIQIPAVVTRGKSVKLTVKTEKLTDREVTISFSAILQLPVFQTEDQEKELKVECAEALLSERDVLEQEYWLYAENSEAQESSILLKGESAAVTLGGQSIPVREGLNLKVHLTNLNPEQSALRELGKINYEQRKVTTGVQEIELAEFKLLRTEGAYVIDSIFDRKRYISTPYGNEQRMEYQRFFEQKAMIYPLKNSNITPAAEAHGDSKNANSIMASGMVEIPLNVDMKKGDICLSEEIMHGLGKGNVYVEAGVQFIETDPVTLRDNKSTVYGEAGLFPDSSHMWVQTAVKVFHDKGSFQVAAKLIGEQRSIVLMLNWVAVKFLTAEESRMEEDCSDWSILPDTPTVSLQARESYSFHVSFQNMKPCRLTYELTENGSGDITGDGVYTAPGREGVYEIHIFCTDFPKISTYVYAVVKKAP